MSESKRPMRAFAEGLLWLDRFREAADWPVPKGLRPLTGDEIYALAYAKGLFAGQESITGRFVGCKDLSSDEIWRRFADAIAWSNEPVDCPTVRPEKAKEPLKEDA